MPRGCGGRASLRRQSRRKDKSPTTTKQNGSCLHFRPHLFRQLTACTILAVVAGAVAVPLLVEHSGQADERRMDSRWSFRRPPQLPNVLAVGPRFLVAN